MIYTVVNRNPIDALTNVQSYTNVTTFINKKHTVIIILKLIILSFNGYALLCFIIIKSNKCIITFGKVYCQCSVPFIIFGRVYAITFR